VNSRPITRYAASTDRLGHRCVGARVGQLGREGATWFEPAVEQGLEHGVVVVEGMGAI
jgi:hypothetical protein